MVHLLDRFDQWTPMAVHINAGPISRRFAFRTMHLLIVEDDKYLSQSLVMALEEQGHSTQLAYDGEEASLALATSNYDLIVLDLNLPRLDGIEVLRRFRTKGGQAPVLILSARDRLEDRVTGLDTGANDYLVKPFELAEFEARVRALLRKEHWLNQVEIKHGNLQFFTNNKELLIGGQKIDLTARELALFEALLSQFGNLVTKRQLLQRLSDFDIELSTNALDIAIHRLRKKLESSTCEIRTVRGIGYTMSEQLIAS
jgi:two-component system OmpR family response regulator